MSGVPQKWRPWPSPESPRPLRHQRPMRAAATTMAAAAGVENASKRGVTSAHNIRAPMTLILGAGLGAPPAPPFGCHGANDGGQTCGMGHISAADQCGTQGESRVAKGFKAPSAPSLHGHGSDSDGLATLAGKMTWVVYRPPILKGMGVVSSSITAAAPVVVVVGSADLAPL